MKKYSLLVFSLGLIILFSCSRSNKYAEIQKLESELYSENFVFDAEGKAKASTLVQAYLTFTEEHPQDTAAPIYLFKAADLSMNLGDASRAINLYNKVIYAYPDFEKNPQCLFLMAFIYENYLQNYGKAKEVYELFLQKYPDHEFADDAQMSLQNLGKSPEELIREFEAKNESQQSAVSGQQSN